MNIRHGLVAAALAALTFSAQALPSVAEVQAQVTQGNYARAEQMMQEVLAGKPGSAKAHYLYAEILAHNGNVYEAAQQAASARRLDPALRFTDAQKFKDFEAMLARDPRSQQPGSAVTPQRPATAAPAAPAVRAEAPLATPPAPQPIAPARAEAAHASGGVPGWVWVLGLAGGLGLLFVVLTRRRMATMNQSATYAPAYAGQSGYGGPAYGGQGGAYGPGHGAGYGAGPAPMAPSGSGSGMLGMGLAAAGGVAAGMLAEKWLSSREHGAAAESAAGTATAAGGLLPTSFDSGASALGYADELQQRSIDFGSGDGWGDDGGGSSDGGGDSGGGDGW